MFYLDDEFQVVVEEWHVFSRVRFPQYFMHNKLLTVWQMNDE